MEIDRTKWLTFYPIYINSEFSRRQGRKTTKELSCEQPDLAIVMNIMKEFQLECVPEPNKRHPADFFSQGRIKYRLKDDQGNYLNEIIKCRQDLYNKIGEKLPKKKIVGKEQTVVKKVKKNKRKK